MTPTAIVLHGTTSAGKSSIARALQASATVPAFHISLDAFVTMSNRRDMRSDAERDEAYAIHCENLLLAVDADVRAKGTAHMAATRKTKANRATARKTARAAKLAKAPKEAMSAIELLKQDHREVEGLFEEFAELNDNAAKAKLAQKICAMLKVHTQIEEEIFYPAARKATKDDDLLDEAMVEHAGAKKLIAEIEAGKPGADMFDAKVKVLGEMIHHHVEEEEDELFPEVEDSKAELEALGKQMAERKAELMQRSAPPPMRKAS